MSVVSYCYRRCCHIACCSLPQLRTSSLSLWLCSITLRLSWPFCAITVHCCAAVLCLSAFHSYHTAFGRTVLVVARAVGVAGVECCLLALR